MCPPEHPEGWRVPDAEASQRVALIFTDMKVTSPAYMVDFIHQNFAGALFEWTAFWCDSNFYHPSVRHTITTIATLTRSDFPPDSIKQWMNILFRDALIGLEQSRFFLAKLSRTEKRSTWLSNLQTACTMMWTLCRDLRLKRAVFWQFVNLPPEIRIKGFTYEEIFPGILGKRLSSVDQSVVLRGQHGTS
jgi:hypothetical protein